MENISVQRRAKNTTMGRNRLEILASPCKRFAFVAMEKRCPPRRVVAPSARFVGSGKLQKDKMKDPSGGTTGRVKPYGRLGWMGARAEYSYGEGLPLPHEIGRRKPAARSKRPAIFFNLLGLDSGTRAYRPAGRLPSPKSDFSDATVATGRIKGAN